MSLTLKEQVDFWVKLSSESLFDMRAALRSGRRTNALFCGHLAIEKALKALCSARYVPSNQIWGHSLIKLSDIAGLWVGFNASQQIELATITSFNIQARYDDYKRKFKLLCTKQYAEQWASIIEKWYADINNIVAQERASLPNRIPAI